MAASSTDRNLLFGILALQMDFISRQQLVDATSAWIEDKTQPIEEILIRQGAMAQRHCDLLRPLVDEHVREHENVVTKSIQAVSSIPSVAEQLMKLGDAEVTASVGHMQTRGDGAEVQTVFAQPSTSSYRYQVLRPHARGGIGQVSIAMDAELHREVALKEIQSHHADNPNSRARFLLEAEITGGLEHPGIVPVYGLGQYSDGRPYYAMRFIRGDSLQEAIDRFHEADGPDRDPGERSLELRKLLGRFLDVCDAVSYAHSRGVLHRDLKPGNVMLGKFGETLVVDWGLAKPMDQPDQKLPSEEAVLRPSISSGTAPTQMGLAVGTPAYMSTEQASGRLDLMGPMTDVYCLGSTLYCLLTGRPPITDRSAATILRKIQEGDIPRPRSIKSQIPLALEAICQKAMALKSEDRYDSARSLAEDVQRWLADEPVGVCREPVSVRARRWMRRHQAIVGSLAGAVIVGVIILTISFGLISSAYAREEAERKRAEDNFVLARSSVDKLFVTVSEDKLLAQPGARHLRGQLLADAMDFYERFLAQPHVDDQLTEQVAKDFTRTGKIKEELGLLDDAVARYERAEKILRSLPPTTNRLRDLAYTTNARGRALHNSGNLDAAELAYTAAAALRGELVTQSPENHEAQREWANSIMNVGLVKKDRGEYDEARKKLDEAQQIRRKFAAPDRRLLLRDLGKGEYNTANLLLQGSPSIDQITQARAHLNRAIELFRRLINTSAAGDPHLAENQYNLASCHYLLGQRDFMHAISEGVLSDLRQAMEQFQKTREIAQKTAWQHVEVPDYRHQLAQSQVNLADADRRLWEQKIEPLADAEKKETFDRAWKNIQHALFILNPLADVYARSEYQYDLSRALANFGRLQFHYKMFDESQDNLDRAVKLLDQLHAESAGRKQQQEYNAFRNVVKGWQAALAKAR